uniref:Uncharacterized protein n=1 Tax=Ignavibacterium album TaxID=591197 RepID=A0A832G8M9_9BACT
MKQNNKVLLLTLREFMWIILFIVQLFAFQIKAQEGQQPTQEFPMGTWATGDVNEPNQYSAISNAGFNWIVQGVNPTNRPYMQNFKIIAQNPNQGEWVYYYSMGKYKKWEAERDKFFFLETGFKHPHNNGNQNTGYLYGRVETLQGVLCWATNDSNPFPVDSILWGPNYTQEKIYKSVDPNYWKKPIKYTVRYRLALKNAPQPADTVCKLYIRYRCAKKENGQTVEIKEEIFDSLYLTAADLPGDTFHIKSLSYIYPETYREQTITQRWSSPNNPVLHYIDTDTLMGMEYCIKWYGRGKLYIDYVEVFDDDQDTPSNRLDGIWKQWLDNPPFVANRINNFLSQYSDWPNIRYWYVIDEPASLDDYEPIRIVDSLVFHFSGRRVITQFTPNWNGYVNGDISVKKFVELTGTNTVMMDYFPFWDGHSSEFGLKHLQPVFQQTAIYSPKFYYVPQGFGQFYDQGFQQPCHWREPTPVEFKSSIMLALTHGAKGIQIWKFATDLQPHHIGWQQCEFVYWKCLAESLETNYRLLPLGEIIKNDIAPRLKGHLDNTLLKLSYTGNFITRKYILPTTELFPEPQTFEYLTIGGNEVTSKDIYWQVGFFADSSNLPFNKYFLLTNLITTYPQKKY